MCGLAAWKSSSLVKHQRVYSPIGRFLVQETFPKTLPWFVLILMERQRNQAFCVTAADWSHDHDLMNINFIVYLMFILPQFRNSWTDFYRQHMVEKQRFLAFISVKIMCVNYIFHRDNIN